MRPLAERMRPRTLDEMVGQKRLLAPNTALRRAIESGRVHSMVLWGPPGCGKTTLALLLARYADAEFRAISAVLSGLPEVRQVLAEAAQRFAEGRRTVLFVDEVHRFNKSQQDAFLPHIERGTIIFVGATTENPSFELNSALLSRCRVHVLEAVSPEDVAEALQRALDMGEHIGGGHQLPGVTPGVVDAQERFTILVPGNEREMIREAVAPDRAAQPRIAERPHGCGSGAGGTIAGDAGTVAPSGVDAGSPSEGTGSRTWPRIGACDARSGAATNAPPTTQTGLSITE